MSNRLKILLGVACAVLLVGYAAFVVWGEKDDDDGREPVARTRVFQGATVPLERGLSASEGEGTLPTKLPTFW